MKNSPITVEHNGVLITYNEDLNRFEFTLRGRDRHAESLAKAREAIDKPVSEKVKPFERIKVYLNRYDGWEQGEVTSIAECGFRPYVWYVCDGQRTKQAAEHLYQVNPTNDAFVAAHKKLQNQMKAIRGEMEAIVRTMDKLELPKEEES